MAWISYPNGNYKVSLNLENGTKIRENDEDFFDADFPESMDLKITNYCNMNCPFCHENSLTNGKHGNIMEASFIDKMHPYTEIAIGGGAAQKHPDIIPFLEKLKSLKMVPSMTIHQHHFFEDYDKINYFLENKLIYGLGISLVDPKQENFISLVKKIPNAVIHVINGIVSIEELKVLKNNDLKILILGYKEVRRGDKYYSLAIEEQKKKLYNMLPIIVKENWFDVISFDNLAIKQLNPQRLMSKEQWDKMYMGDDGIDGTQTSASLYIDLVENKFSRNSCDITHKYPINNLTAQEMYQFLKNKKT